MYKLLISIIFVIASVYGDGELLVLHHPNSLIFKGHDPVRESILREIYSASLGFSTQQYSNWNGLFIQDPFNLPEAVVTVAVDGVANTEYAKGHHYPLRTDEDEFNIYSSLKLRVSERYPESDNMLVRVDLSTGLEDLNQYDFLRGIKISSKNLPKSAHQYLKNNVEEHREFLKDVEVLNAISEKIENNAVKSDSTPDVFWFKISSIHPLVDLYGENSTQVKEAKQLLNDAITRLNKAFKSAYKGNVLFNVVSSDAIHTRRTRSILKAEDDVTPDLNLAKQYDENYPVIFNIILWFGVAMVFSLLAICMAIGTMDPGRDSIIYRMTSTRMKKDN